MESRVNKLTAALNRARRKQNKEKLTLQLNSARALLREMKRAATYKVLKETNESFAAMGDYGRTLIDRQPR